MGLDLQFRYDWNDGAGATITLEKLTETTIVQSSEGPFTTEANSGSWVELRNSRDETLFTRSEYELISETIEAVGPSRGSFTQVTVCPHTGIIQIGNLANLPDATQVVLLQEAIDGDAGGPTVVFARFTLP